MGTCMSSPTVRPLSLLQVPLCPVHPGAGAPQGTPAWAQQSSEVPRISIWSPCDSKTHVCMQGQPLTHLPHWWPGKWAVSSHLTGEEAEGRGAAPLGLLEDRGGRWPDFRIPGPHQAAEEIRPLSQHSLVLGGGQPLSHQGDEAQSLALCGPRSLG